MLCDLSFNNLPDGYSKDVDTVFLAGKFNIQSLASQKSTGICRIARSTLATQTLALSYSTYTTCYTTCFIDQLGGELSLIQQTPQITT